VVNHRVAIVIVAIGSISPLASANAGPCAAAIVAFRNALPQDADGEPAVVGTAPQSVDAQLRHQPTPDSVERAKKGARSAIAASLAEAEKLDAEGNQSACEETLAKARLLAGP
jgi:hypothetical protein